METAVKDEEMEDPMLAKLNAPSSISVQSVPHTTQSKSGLAKIPTS